MLNPSPLEAGCLRGTAPALGTFAVERRDLARPSRQGTDLTRTFTWRNTAEDLFGGPQGSPLTDAGDSRCCAVGR
jgi:hypothetical protein